jgi:hypothetical protein
MDISVGLTTGGIQLMQNIFKSELSTNIENSSLQIWPNPGKEYVQIMANGNGMYELIDITGKKLIASVQMEKLYPVRLDISQIPRGVYFIKFTSSKNQISFKKLVLD